MTEFSNRNIFTDLGVPRYYGHVVEDTEFTIGGKLYCARVIVADADGTIDVIMPDGTTEIEDMQVFKGANVLPCRKVTAVNGLTLDWYA